MRSARSCSLLPERTPTRGDLLATALGLAWATLQLTMADRVAWPVFAGSAVLVLALAPLATTSPAVRLRRSVPALGVRGRTAVILAFAGAVWLAAWLVDIPATILLSHGTGVIVGTAVVVVVQVVAGAVDGWTH